METNIPITLKAKHHAFIISFIDNKGTIEVINYINQVRKNLYTTTTEDVIVIDEPEVLDEEGNVITPAQTHTEQVEVNTIDPEKNIEVVVDGQFVADLFYLIGCMPERLVNADNTIIKQALIPQLMTSPLTLQALIIRQTLNGDETEAKRQDGFNYIEKIIV